jgi:hypothetical protein
MKTVIISKDLGKSLDYAKKYKLDLLNTCVRTEESFQREVRGDVWEGLVIRPRKENK